jgi:hypothetical protein
VFNTEQFHVEQHCDPWYVTGLCQAKGKFTYSKAGGSMLVHFGLTLGVSDGPLLQAIQRFFTGAGSIYFARLRGIAGGPRAQSQLYYRVSRARELPVIVSHFTAYPLKGTKRLEFDAWRQMAELKQRFRKPAMTELAVLAARLSALKRPLLTPLAEDPQATLGRQPGHEHSLHSDTLQP